MDITVRVDKQILGLAGQNPLPRKVAYLLTVVEFGGAQRVCLSFLQHYRSKDIHVFPILLCRPWEKDNFFSGQLAGSNIEFSTVATRLRPKGEGGDYFRSVRRVKDLCAELKKGQFDLIHAHGSLADTLGVVAAKKLGIPVISTSHGFISNHWKYRLHNTMDVVSLRFMDRIIAVSDQLKKDLIAKGVKEQKIHVIQNAVEVPYSAEKLLQQRSQVRAEYGLGNTVIVLGFVGRLSFEKGINYLLEAGATLVSDGFQIRILVIGNGPQEEEMRQLARELGIEDIVVFTGFQKEVSTLLPALDIFVLPSLTEGTSMALLEAMACSLPVVATGVGGTPKVIQSEKNGLLVPSKSSQVIAQAVNRLIKDQKLRKQMGQAALQTIKTRFGIRNWLRKINEIYDAILH